MEQILQTEAQTQKQILQWLAWHKIYAWRNNSGRIFIQGKDKVRMFGGGVKGGADIIGILNDGSGRMLAIECKKLKGKLTDNQEQFLNKIKENNGIAFIARSLEDCERELKNYLK